MIVFTEYLCTLPKMSNGARGRTRTGTGLLPRDFKSLASANFATRASDTSSQTKVEIWRPGSDSNRRRRLCRPLHNPSATRPRFGDKSDFGFLRLCLFEENGAGNEVRTRDLNLGKVALYQLSYSRFDLTIQKFYRRTFFN